MFDSAIVEAGGQEDAHGDEELVSADHGTSDPGRRRLGLVHGDKQTQGTNAQAGHESANHDLIPCRDRRNLDNETDGHNKTPERDGGPATNAVGDGCGHQGSDESTDGQESDNETGADIAEVLGAIRVGLAKSVQEIGHLKETRDLTSVVTEAG